MDAYKRIIEVSADLFVKFGAKSITMNDISDKAGISKKTLYELFDNKDELLSKCIDFIHEQSDRERLELFESKEISIELVIEIVRKTALRINSINPNFVSDIKKYYPDIYKTKINQMERKAIEFYIEIIKVGVDKGLFRSNINVEIASNLLHEQINQLIHTDTFPSDKFPKSEVFRTMMDIFIRGIATQESLKELIEIEKKESSLGGIF